ncbi:MAG: hypothetical protein FXF49_04045 [Flexistipes sinusarabici]|uniref:YlbF family regulator n=1 Tax=Flexistipes sinusarabici TaxID=2352 RepID=A0A5D0MLH3_FLESI|nr:hypothetical protein [Flexistipes sinusarabici]TYB33866.1 MAG: hypothetical protein FXF49_04045 [Flexistipes sinusarabici]
MRREAFELKKEITIMEDFAEAEEMQGEIEELEKARNDYDEIYNKLSDEDKAWVNEQFFKWIELYSGNCGAGCGSCGSACA